MRYLYLLYLWLIAAPILLVLTIITCIVTIIGCLFNDNWWGYYPPKLWAMVWCTLLGIRVKVKNRELIDKRTSYVFVANHQGAFDIFAIYGFLGHNFKWLMRKGLKNIPLVGVACKAAGHVFVDHSSQAAVKKTMAEAEKKLTRGTSIVVFPEGRRTSDGHLQKFKHGAFRLAEEFKLPVVPITVDGSYKAMPRGSFLPHPCTIILTLHAPIFEVDDMHVLAQQCYDIIAESLPTENR